MMLVWLHTIFFIIVPQAQAGNVPLLEPIGKVKTIPAGSGVSVIQQYIAGIWPWLIGIGVGLAIAGLLMLIMAGAILAAINPSAYGVV